MRDRFIRPSALIILTLPLFGFANLTSMVADNPAGRAVGSSGENKSPDSAGVREKRSLVMRSFGTVTIGVYETASQTFYLRNSNSIGFADLTIMYGPPGTTALAGNWDGL